MQTCTNPEGALQLAACIAASSSAAAVHPAHLAAEHSLFTGSAAAAVEALPAVLALLLSSRGWQHSGSASLLLQRLAAALQQGLLQQCLLAARSWLPPDAPSCLLAVNPSVAA